MYKVILSPYSRKLRNMDGQNPKNYDKWEEVVNLLKKENVEVIQVGLLNEDKINGVKEFQTNLSFSQLKDLLFKCDTWMSVDNFFNHFATYHKKTPGVVVFGRSDPNIFGYPENYNLLKNRKYLRKDQFNIWEAIKYSSEVFVDPDFIVKYVMKAINNKTF